ncbi:MAG: HAD family hydrolase, partial [Lachnospiraceae bacterium]|nr:HAD family hydrolase [Lachnospiraceae bacterium]
KPEDCLMVGNDVDEDMVAANLGMKVFLLTDCMINKSSKDIEEFPHGGFDELSEYIAKISG